jgi:hypothetical protein
MASQQRFKEATRRRAQGATLQNWPTATTAAFPPCAAPPAPHDRHGGKDRASTSGRAYISGMIYRLDPKNPRQLTPEEARRLDEAPIDYSDIPPLGDEFFTRAQRAMIDWSQCPDVERTADTLSGAWRIVSARAASLSSGRAAGALRESLG